MPINLSILLPVHNERGNLPPLLAEIETVIAALPEKYRPAEIICVDDGSTDGSGVWLDDWAAHAPAQRVIVHHPANRGQSAAFWSGFQKIRGAICITLDSDGQNDPADIPALLIRLDDHDGADLVCGIRARRRDSWPKRCASVIGNGVRNVLLGESIRDTGCSLKAFHSRFLPELPWFDGAHRFIPALFALKTRRIVEIPVNHRPRRSGASHYGNLLRGWQGLRHIFHLRRLQRQNR